MRRGPGAEMMTSAQREDEQVAQHLLVIVADQVIQPGVSANPEASAAIVVGFCRVGGEDEYRQ